jgi:DNA-binding CsgD family transcriptional regulator
MKVRKLKKSNLKEVQKAQVKLLFSEGYTIDEIKEAVDMSYGQIHDYLLAEGIIKKHPRLFQKTKEKRIAGLFQKGKTPREIGNELNLKASIVGHILRKLNLVERKQYYAGQEFPSSTEMGIFKKKLRIKVRKDYNSGKRKEEIAEENKISLQSVTNYLKGV